MLLEGTFLAYVNLGRSNGFKLVQRKTKCAVCNISAVQFALHSTNVAVLP